MTLPFNRIFLVVLDLDGTLVDAFGDIHAATNHVLAELGRELLDLETVRGFVGHGVHNLMRGALGADDPVLVNRAVELWKEYATAHPADHAQLYPGAREFLELLEQRGIKRAVLSNKVHEITVEVMRQLGVADLLDGIWGDQPGYKIKPDPQALLALIRRMGVMPGETLVVGDGEPDVAVARAVGAWSCGAAWGLSTAAELLAMGADCVVESFKELAKEL